MQNRAVRANVGIDPTVQPEGCRTSIDVKRAAPAGHRQRTATVAAWMLVLVSCSVSSGDQLKELAEKVGIRILADGDSSSDAQKKSGTAIPLHQLSPASRLRARKILDNCSQYRKLPSLQYSIDEPMYRYLLQHPDVAVSTWRVMGISRFEMWQTGPQEFEAQAIDGSEGLVDILYQDHGQMLFICEGNYHNVLLPKPLEASALVWFRMSCAPGAAGSQTVTQLADVYVRFPSAGVSAVAKMLTPVTNSLMDRNLFEVSLYGSMMSRAVRDEPEWVVQVAEQMEGVLPQRKGELVSVARQPRRSMSSGTAQAGTVETVSRSVIMSPQLLFFDPPKDGTNAQPEKPKTQSDDEFELQPAVPPVGPTATGPAGSGPATPGNR